jgi:pimeloyl-ACP methyl ester carboxylesterase
MSTSEICRTPVNFKSGNETLFGWLHAAHGLHSSAPVCVICAPLGFEYMSSYRSVRHLADSIASRGWSALRFDYAYTGDSAGEDFSEARLSDFTRSTSAAVDFARKISRHDEAALIGIGIGGAFAAAVASEKPVDHLVLWNPPGSGKRYLRELRLLSEYLSTASRQRDESLDAAGVYLTPDVQADFQAIHLAKLDYTGVQSCLLVNRVDMRRGTPLAGALREACAEFEEVSIPGYREMMDAPTDTLVPTEAIEYISNWIARRATKATYPAGNPLRPELQPLQGEGYQEEPVKFGPAEKLFGVVARPSDQTSTDASRPAFLMLNCGSEHHVGPQRLYTTIGRRLARAGHIVLRFDLEGIGDSISIGNNPENNPYSPVALDDIEQALQFLNKRYGCDRFIATGVCAGAYHSFKAAVEITGFNIERAILVNPLVFEWRHNRPPDNTLYEVDHYRHSLSSSEKWKKLLHGDVRIGHLAMVFLRYAYSQTRRGLARQLNSAIGKRLSGLDSDLQTLELLERPISIVLGDPDPGYRIMLSQGRRSTLAAKRSGLLTIHSLGDADHALSKKYMRDRLIDYFDEQFA